MNYNKIIVIGRITREPELKATPGGTHICSFSVATNFTYKKDDKKEEKVTFHNVICFGKTAETVAKYFIKGQEILVEGRQDNRSYEKKDGTKGYTSEIILERFDFGQKPKGAEDRPAKSADEEYNQIGGSEEINLDDIPF